MSFDTLAPHYRWMERLLAGGKLQRCRTAFLEETRVARSVLLVGEGHGRFLPELCRINPGASITCLDASREMNRVAKENLVRNGLESDRVRFHSAPVLDFPFTTSYDLICTHFFLDCFDQAELGLVIGTLAQALAPGGKWIIADFQVPAGGWQKLRARAVLKLAYSFFQVAVRLPARRLVNPKPHLRENGLVQEGRAQFNYGLLYAEIWRRPATLAGKV